MRSGKQDPEFSFRQQMDVQKVFDRIRRFGEQTPQKYFDGSRHELKERDKGMRFIRRPEGWGLDEKTLAAPLDFRRKQTSVIETADMLDGGIGKHDVEFPVSEGESSPLINHSSDHAGGCGIRHVQQGHIRDLGNRFPEIGFPSRVQDLLVAPDMKTGQEEFHPSFSIKMGKPKIQREPFFYLFGLEHDFSRGKMSGNAINRVYTPACNRPRISMSLSTEFGHWYRRTRSRPECIFSLYRLRFSSKASICLAISSGRFGSA